MAVGLVAPEGTYVPAASYVPPAGPPITASLISSATGASVASPTTSQAGQSSSSATAAASSSSVQSTPAAASSAAGTSAIPVAPHPLGGQPQQLVSPPAGANASALVGSTGVGLRRAISTSTTGGMAMQNAASSQGVGDAAIAASGAMTDASGDDLHRATALLHISMHAPSVWANTPNMTPARISVAGVRNTQQTSSGSMSSSLTGLGGNSSAPSGSDDDQSESISDVSEDREANKASTSNRFFGFGSSSRTTAQAGPSNVAPAPWHPIIEATLATQGIDGAASHVTGGQGGLPGVAGLQLLSHLAGSAAIAAANSSAATAGGNSAALGLNGMPPVTPGGGRNLLKPKNNLKQSSSTFVTRMQAHPDFPKMLAVQKPADAIVERHMFVSRGRLLCWLGETSQGWIRDPIARITFSSFITTHDVNQWTRSPNRLDVIIGFAVSDLIWLEAVSMRYSRINKSGCLYDVPVSNVRWVPGSETLFIATHTDGTCSLLDVSREDCAPSAWTPTTGREEQARGNMAEPDNLDSQDEAREILTPEINGDGEQLNSILGAMESDLEDEERMEQPSWDPAAHMLVTRPGGLDPEMGRKWAKFNPVAHWRVARPTTITDLAFSPDHTKLALTAIDGRLRLINLLTESLEGTFEAYYGALNRVVWSPDAKFLLTAGCDDMISIWTNTGRLLGRCRGHNSFVTGLAFDPWRWRLEDRTYRFVSVGEDGCVFLWDFSSAALHRPRQNAHGNVNGRRRTGQSNSSGCAQTGASSSKHRGNSFGAGSAPFASDSIFNGVDGFGQHAGGEARSHGAIYVPAPSRRDVAELQPVASFQIGPITTLDAACNATGIVSTGCSISGVPFANADSLSSSVTTASSSNEGGVSMARGASSGGAAATGSANAAGGVGSAQGGSTSIGTTATAGAAAVEKTMEQGGPSDILVDVRCRPDGFIVVHRSGTLRFLRRPPLQQPAPTISQPRSIPQAAL